jgi:hypothetical protein
MAGDTVTSRSMMSSSGNDTETSNTHTHTSTRSSSYPGSNSTPSTTTLLSREEQLIVCMMRRQSSRGRGASSVLPAAAAELSSTSTQEGAHFGQQLLQYSGNQGLLSASVPATGAGAGITAAGSRSVNRNNADYGYHYPPLNSNHQQAAESSQTPAASALGRTHNIYQSLIQQQQQQQQHLPPELQTILNRRQQQQRQAPPGPQAATASSLPTRTPLSTGTLAPTGADTADTSADPTQLPTPAATPIAVPQPFGRDGQAESFPGKLYRLLAEVERSGNTHIISFTPNGRSFLIHDPDAFMSDIAPTFFSQTRFTSFRRQLSFYGFDRISKNVDRGAFSHPSFLRGRPELLGGVRRQIVVVPRAKQK